MAVPVTVDARRNVVSPVPGLCRTTIARTRQRRLKLSLDHALDKAPHLGADARFDRIEPVVKKVGAAESCRM